MRYKLTDIKELWYRAPRKFRFLIIGGINSLISYGFYAGFCFLLGAAGYQISLGLAWFISSVISFSAQKTLVFQSEGNWLREYFKCCTTWVLSYLLNAFLLEICVKLLRWNIFTSQILATVTVAVFTYILFKTFAFKTNSSEG